ncbi:MAG: FecR domain-containing protein [Deferribacteres bacterium]|nr:FecR domain-containing protein [candidate division KSB1 bacterium]MCB9510323.1 FecR domain-containing protein [Deferribacteres bacterium]
MEQLDYKILMAKALADQLSEQEHVQFESWLAASEQNRMAFRELQQVWARTEGPGAPSMPDIDAEWQKLETRLGLRQPATVRAMPGRPTPAAVRSGFSGWQRLAVAATVLIAIAGLSWWFGQSPAPGLAEVATANAETRTITLADGSEVTLNNDSQIRFQADLAGDQRLVVLTGEAYFDVVKDGRPFVVQTENARIRVLGTSFNIWSRQRETRVIVSEGRVSVRGAAQVSDSVVLTANQMAVCKGDLAPEAIGEIDSEVAIGWREGRIVFNESTLPEVIAELRRIYDADIVLQDSTLEELSISGNFQPQPLADVLDAICLSLGIRYEMAGQQYVLGK